jgi:hypothetical protein
MLITLCHCAEVCFSAAKITGNHSDSPTSGKQHFIYFSNIIKHHYCYDLFTFKSLNWLCHLVKFP